eukprot:scaffold271746_cov27-Tisochrysis_lutea.AAC.3
MPRRAADMRPQATASVGRSHWCRSCQIRGAPQGFVGLHPCGSSGTLERGGGGFDIRSGPADWM